ncbi:DapH/DapD/GlmU-related protein [Modicisalibacter xianhensis]|uniref:DapH/DapD/GlmU-related protein n=1 Tax=Modicisalibacter xianhensis TaxID=442341 RepID=UPI00106413F2|nr:acyltransferase [Halomonas xianhensis]
MRIWLRKSIKKLIQFFWTRRVLRNCGSAKGNVYANNKVTVTKNTHLGNNINFNGMSITGGGEVVICDNFHSGPECLIITHFHNFDEGVAIPYDNTYIHKDVFIGDNVWLGSRVIILGGVKIGEGAIIQAGSVVVSDIPDFAVAGGHPATVFKYRDIEHYMKLKMEEKFN